MHHISSSFSAGRTHQDPIQTHVDARPKTWDSGLHCYHLLGSTAWLPRAVHDENVSSSVIRHLHGVSAEQTQKERKPSSSLERNQISKL